MSPASNSFFVDGTESLIVSPIIVRPGSGMNWSFQVGCVKRTIASVGATDVCGAFHAPYKITSLLPRRFGTRLCCRALGDRGARGGPFVLAARRAVRQLEVGMDHHAVVFHNRLGIGDLLAVLIPGAVNSTS